MKDIYAEELMVLSSIQLFGADPNHIKPELFGTGFILNHREKFYFVSVFHNIKYRDLAIYLETNLPPENGTVPLVPIGGFVYFDLLKVAKDAKANELVAELEKGGERIDITFAKLEKLPELLQPEMDFKFMKIEKDGKMYLKSESIGEPNKSETYGFFGKIKHKYDGVYLKMTPTLKNNLKYHNTSKEFYRFKAPQLIKTKDEYEGCSGAPILDSNGRLVGLACKVKTGSLLVYGFSMKECLRLLDISIDTKQI